MPGNFYVSVYDKDTGRIGVLLGPFAEHDIALEMVKSVESLAISLSERNFWYSYGTVQMKDTFKEPGRLNSYFPEISQKVNSRS